MSKRYYALIGLGCALTFIALVVTHRDVGTQAAVSVPTVTPAGGSQTFPDDRAIQPILTPGAQASPQEGRPAIRPRTVGTGATTPAFTEQDVRDYMSAHPRGDGAGAITKVEFITTRQFSTEMNDSFAIDDTRLLCVVQFSGTFMYGGPKRLPDTPQTPRMGHVAYSVFDAHTGNLLIEAIDDR